MISSQGFLRFAEALIDRAKTLQNLEDVVELKAGKTDALKEWTPLFFAVANGPNGHPEIV